MSFAPNSLGVCKDCGCLAENGIVCLGVIICFGADLPRRVGAKQPKGRTNAQCPLYVANRIPTPKCKFMKLNIGIMVLVVYNIGVR